jgi:hypothetical protein
MTVSTMFLMILGLAASFLPLEILSYAGSRPDSATALLVQIAGALYLGFAMLNWMSRGQAFGGIYGRPLVLGNLMHFAVAAAALVQSHLAPMAPMMLVGIAVYVLLAIWFGLVLFTHPVIDAQSES